MSDLQQTPLTDLHIELGAKMAPFAGYSMPISYPLGLMKEHLHCREHAGLFDVCHMGQVQIEGPDLIPFLNRLLPLNADKIAVGRCKYSFLLNEHAGILDDLILSRIAERRFLLVVNGACKDKDLAHMHALASQGFDVQIELLQRGLIALQGPKAEAVLEREGLAVADMGFMSIKLIGDLMVTRSGYTGEDGFELSMTAAQTEAFARRLLAHEEVEALGLGARDSLRLEAGLPLYGQDLSEEINPVEAGLTWAIPKSIRQEGVFLGAEKIAALVAGPPTVRKAIGFQASGRAPVRAGATLHDEDGREIGVITSGGFGPTVEGPVALALIERSNAEIGAKLFAQVRNKSLPGLVCKPPFSPHRYKVTSKAS